MSDLCEQMKTRTAFPDRQRTVASPLQTVTTSSGRARREKAQLEEVPFREAKVAVTDRIGLDSDRRSPRIEEAGKGEPWHAARLKG